MIVVMKSAATDEDVRRVVDRIEAAGCEARVDRGVERTVIGVRTGRHDLQPEMFLTLPGVDDAVRILKPFKLASRDFHPQDTVFGASGVTVGGTEVVAMAGPCSVESEPQMIETAHAVKAAGAAILRGGAFKPRSSPYAFQGLGEEGLKILAAAREASGLPIVTEVLHPRAIEVVGRYADIFQIGARNMQNYDLLKEVAGAGKPVFLKRGMAATVQDLLLSAEYLLAGGCEEIILCERGIRTYETATRNTLDISAVPVLKRMTHLPVAVDPSHASGHAVYVRSLALAAVAAGADVLMVEVHPDPAGALSDGEQSLQFDAFRELMAACRQVAGAIGRMMREPEA